MLISARHIVDWAGQRRAEGELPLLVRRLIGRAASVTALAMPGGDAVNTPGWDGDVYAETGDAWVPQGRSCWEMGKSKGYKTKADDDYAKRTGETPADQRRETAFVFVTPRKWQGKTTWRNEQAAKGEWRDVRVYDALDLEQWLEHQAAVALWFADLIGVAGPGVEAPAAYWRRWAEQTTPHISRDGFLSGRAAAAERLTGLLRTRKVPYTLTADTVEEAAAFAVACILAAPDLERRAVVATSAEGWRFIDKNPVIDIVVAADEATARQASPCSDRLIVMGKAAGGHLRRPEEHDAGRLPRPDLRAFDQALTGMGFEAKDAQRQAGHCGRSWSVWRRLHADNPALRRPAWLDREEARAVGVLCLVGEWLDDGKNDPHIVAEIAARPYADIDKDLRALAAGDDSPVLLIGKLRRAKAPLELLHQWGDRLTEAEIDRFFACLQGILTTPDPELELPDDQRWMAGFYGKARAESGALIESMLDSLIKLAVRGGDMDGLAAMRLPERAADLVRALLHGADRTRWLSLSSWLPQLAEAAPDAYLAAVRDALRRPDDPVSALITESTATGVTGRCWHTGLLWSLERLAWAPQRLGAVADSLARLCAAPVPGNWGNTPFGSLKSLFRSWSPHTTADLPQRLAALDRVVDDHPAVGWDLLLSLADTRGDHCVTPPALSWRDDDAGAEVGPTYGEVVDTLRHVHNRLFDLAAGDADRTATLIGKADALHPDDLARLWALTETFAAPGVADDLVRERLCSALRHYLHRRLNYSQSGEEAVTQLTATPAALYDRLQPDDPVIRHRWLFASGWPELPEKTDITDETTRLERQKSALSEALAAEGALDRFIAQCAEPYAVGWMTAQVDLPDDWLERWLSERIGRFDDDSALRLAATGLLHGLPVERRQPTIERLLAAATEDKALALLLAAPADAWTWDRVAALGAAVADRYWKAVSTPYPHTTADAVFAAERLLGVQRPWAALSALRLAYKTVPTTLLLRILKELLTTRENIGDGQLIQYLVGEALDRITDDPALADNDVIPVEFAFSKLFTHRPNKKPRIYRALATDPDFFIQLLRLVYRRSDGMEDAEGTPEVAKSAWRVLHDWRRIPGADDDGVINAAVFNDWIDRALTAAAQCDRSAIAQSVIGGVLAHAPVDPVDGLWPVAVLRDVLDRPNLDSLRNGLNCGLFNKRGVVSRSLTEGGGQERALAQTYRAWADGLAGRWWNLAETLRDLAEGYERRGADEDAEAARRAEER